MMNRFQLFILPQINIFSIDHRMDRHTSLDLYRQETKVKKKKRLPSDYGLPSGCGVPFKYQNKFSNFRILSFSNMFNFV